jgi:hypothetical protein
MKVTLIPWIAGWIILCAVGAVACIFIGFRAVQNSNLRLEERTGKLFLFAMGGIILGCIGLLVCK